MPPRSARFQDHFADLTDPRRRKVVYPLINIVAIAICAVIAGADEFVSIAGVPGTPHSTPGPSHGSWLLPFQNSAQVFLKCRKKRFVA